MPLDNSPPHPKKGETPEDCRKKAEAGLGAHSYDEFGEACWRVYGKEIKIKDDRDSIMEGFIIVNINFSVSSSQPAVGSQMDLPGGFNETNRNSSNKGFQKINPGSFDSPLHYSGV